MIALAGDQRRAERAHDAGDIRADHAAAGDFLECAEHRVIIEGTALDHDVLAERAGGGYLDDLEQGILDDRVGKAGRNVGHLRALLLGLLDLGVHEDRAARAEVDRMLREQGRSGKILDGVVERLGKGLDEGPAAGGAGLVQRDGIDGMILDADALHVLSADIENAVHIRVEELRGIVMRDGLDLAVIEQEGSLEQRLAIAR